MPPYLPQFRQQKKHNGLLLVAASRGYLADVRTALLPPLLSSSPPHACTHSPAQVEGLVELGASLDCRDKQGRGPLHFAAAHGRAEVARFLWSRGAEVDAEAPGQRGDGGRAVGIQGAGRGWLVGGVSSCSSCLCLC